MQVPEIIRDCVVFVWYRSEKRGPQLAGTAFIVGKISERLSDTVFLYLVTAKHVIVSARESSSDKKIYVRINLKIGGAISIEFSADQWMFHEDALVDVSVAPLSVPIKHFKCAYVGIGMFVNHDIIKIEDIGLADDILIAGLFSNHVGKLRNIPIIRVGNIASMPEEPIHTKFGPMDAYLIEARSIGGLSGSPVFVYLSETRRIQTERGFTYRGKWSIYLLGLIHGHWDIPKSTEPAGTVEQPFQNERLNVGIAMVVPASKILETLNYNWPLDV